MAPHTECIESIGIGCKTKKKFEPYVWVCTFIKYKIWLKEHDQSSTWLYCEYAVEYFNLFSNMIIYVKKKLLHNNWPLTARLNADIPVLYYHLVNTVSTYKLWSNLASKYPLWILFISWYNARGDSLLLFKASWCWQYWQTYIQCFALTLIYKENCTSISW